ncbi:MAG TPA: molybdenum cofactor biosynthesis protein MoaE [Acidimicrobiales bacterium]|nr:molybdenum cofactor biosynthesis protein MoaE [Acidimicrobiales bacterium]
MSEPGTDADDHRAMLASATERALAAIEDQARTRWQLDQVLIIHRHGAMRPGEIIMMVATSARHRADAFAAAVAGFVAGLPADRPQVL